MKERQRNTKEERDDDAGKLRSCRRRKPWSKWVSRFERLGENVE